MPGIQSEPVPLGNYLCKFVRACARVVNIRNWRSHINIQTILAAVAATALGAVDAFGVNDDHGDTNNAATLLPIGQWKTGVTDGRGDVDTFRVDMVGQAAVELRSSGPTDTVGTLKDSSGRLIATDDDTGPGLNFRITADLDPGVYFLEVEDYFGTPNGNYAVAVQLAASGDHAETHQAATLLRLITAQELEGVRPETLLSTAGRLAADDTDMFRIDVLHDSTPVTIRSAGNTDTVGELYSADDSGLTLLEQDDDSGRMWNFQIETVLDRGVHYIRIAGDDDTGSYRILAVAHDRPDEADANP